MTGPGWARPCWARLRFAGTAKRWRLFEGGGLVAACERQSLDYPRIERREGADPPPDGKPCRYCLAIAAKRARRAARTSP